VIFVAGGTGFAPIKSMIEQLFKMGPDRSSVVLFWGAHDSDGFYELDEVSAWTRENPNFGIILATRNVLPGFTTPEGTAVIKESLADALRNAVNDLKGYDAYVAGPPSMIPAVIKSLVAKGVKHERVKVDSFSG
jgi:CDP-4-dehydro-6-deoxyglucose reductase, E3